MSLKKAMKFADQGDYKSAYETLVLLLSPPVKLDWIKDYNKLFPTAGEVEEDTGKPIPYSPRQSLTQVMARMKIFMKSYMPKEFPMIAPADRPEKIMEATKMYIEERRLEDWAFIKKSNKFINDQNGSMLIDYLRRVLEEKPVVERKATW